jgi:hypothetical protein
MAASAATADASTKTIQLKATPLTPETFKPFGQASAAGQAHRWQYAACSSVLYTHAMLLLPGRSLESLTRAHSLPQSTCHFHMYSGQSPFTNGPLA